AVVRPHASHRRRQPPHWHRARRTGSRDGCHTSPVMTRVPRWLVVFVVSAPLLAMIGAISPAPGRVTDQRTYEATAAQVIVPDCSDLQCFRVLVPWILGRLPGPSVWRWKVYAAVANAAAAAAVFVLCMTIGLSQRAAAVAAALSACGFGSLYTLHDPFTS